MASSEIVFNTEQKEDLCNLFKQLDMDGNGNLDYSEIVVGLNCLGLKVAAYQVRDFIQEYGIEENSGLLSFSAFEKLYGQLRLRDHGFTAKQHVKARDDITIYTSQSAYANEDTRHTIRYEEQKAFADWINRKLASDAVCSRYLPFSEDGSDMYDKCRDGIILCKIINTSVPDTIDERTLNTGADLSVFHRRENIVLALNSARSIGCNVVNVWPEHIDTGVKHLLLGILWQTIKVGLLAEINLNSNSELACLKTHDEELQDLRKLSPVDLLLRWVNYQLEQTKCHRRIKNFSSDIQDSVVYAYLLQQVAPADKLRNHSSVEDILKLTDLHERANQVLCNAQAIDARAFLTTEDIVGGNAKLNMAFVANLFNLYSNMDPLQPEESDNFDLGETREEKTFRNWINSLGLPNTSFCNYLFHDLCNGLIYFRIFDIIHPNIVNWDRVNVNFSKFKESFQLLENCNYVIELGKQLGFSLVGIGGEDLSVGNKKLTLAVVWQLMRAYTLSILSKLDQCGKRIEDAVILEWANSTLRKHGKTNLIPSFQDLSLRTGLALIDLVDALQPGVVDYSLVQTTGNSLMNAKYAISMARKIGSKVFALPEDITELNSKMILTMVACLMIVSLERTSAKE